MAIWQTLPGVMPQIVSQEVVSLEASLRHMKCVSKPMHVTAW